MGDPGLARKVGRSFKMLAAKMRWNLKRSCYTESYMRYIVITLIYLAILKDQYCYVWTFSSTLRIRPGHPYPKQIGALQVRPPPMQPLIHAIYFLT